MSSEAAGLQRLPVRVGADLETHAFGAERLTPPVVCATFSRQTADGSVGGFLIASGDAPIEGLSAPFGAFLEVLSDPTIELAFCNAAYDLCCLMVGCERLIVPIFDALEAGRIRDVSIREKLLNVAEYGDTEYREIPDGTKIRIRGYSLGDLERSYDIVDAARDWEKRDDAEDSVRLSFEGLDGLPSERYPSEMSEYAIKDSVRTLMVCDLQDARARLLIEEGRVGDDPFATEPLRTATSVALYLASATGIRIDLTRRDAVEAEIKARVTPQALPLLYASGILRPARVGVVGARGRTLADKKESVDTTKLRALVEAVALRCGEEVKQNTKGVSTDAETIERLAPHDAVLAEYERRQANMKMLTTDLPRMSAPFVHPNFDVVKNTGRTSSYAAKKYPSMNVQNPHPDARQMVVPRDGNVLFSVDFGSIELVTLAQACYSVLGYSVLRDILNAGVDPHAYLGSTLCHALQPGFAEACDAQGITDPSGIFQAFLSLKKATCDTHGRYEDACGQCLAASEQRKVFAHYRKFAKPTGLGYPGGLGPDTFIVYARGTYGVDVDRNLAVMLQKLWHSTYPEMKPYFEFVKRTLADPFRPGRHAYRTPKGMYRSNCTFPAAANGFGLQSPAAEGGTLAFYRISRECYDASLGSVLLGKTWPLAFIHDEVFGETPYDEGTHERIERIQAIMLESMKTVTPDVAVRTAACLMDRWNKTAEPVYGPDGRLTIWRPDR